MCSSLKRGHKESVFVYHKVLFMEVIRFWQKSGEEIQKLRRYVYADKNN